MHFFYFLKKFFLFLRFQNRKTGRIYSTDFYFIKCHQKILLISFSNKNDSQRGEEIYLFRKNNIINTPWQCQKRRSLWKHFSSLISTRIISSPIWQIQFHGMMYSLSPPGIKQNLLGPGTMRAVILPVPWSNSRTIGQPRLRQVQVLIISFCLSSHSLIDLPFLWEYM